MASLILDASSLKIVGEGRIAASFTTQSAKALLALPPDRKLCRFGQPALLYASDILQRLTTDSLASFFTACTKDAELMKQLTHKRENYASFANPSTGLWGLQHDQTLVLDMILVGQSYISCICWLITGRVLYLTDGTMDTIEHTEVEFSEAYGIDPVNHLRQFLPISINNCTRALNIIENCKPHKAMVSFIDKKSSTVDRKAITFWQPEQVDMYLNRQDCDKIGTDQLDPADEDHDNESA